MESDLSRYHQIDYRDRWRYDDNGVRKLTLRMIAVRIRHLPADSSIAIARGGSGWLIGDYLLADLFHATSGRAHPANPRPDAPPDPVREKSLNAARARAKERQRQIDAGEII